MHNVCCTAVSYALLPNVETQYKFVENVSQQNKHAWKETYKRETKRSFKSHCASLCYDPSLNNEELSVPCESAPSSESLTDTSESTDLKFKVLFSRACLPSRLQFWSDVWFRSFCSNSAHGSSSIEG